MDGRKRGTMEIATTASANAAADPSAAPSKAIQFRTVPLISLVLYLYLVFYHYGRVSSQMSSIAPPVFSVTLTTIPMSPRYVLRPGLIF
ncbi:hypothetical protein U1Q18_035481 [Sarracenia purpurea var. burkii]